MLEGFLALIDAKLGLAALVAAFSGLVHGYTGFGAAFLMTPLFALLVGPIESIAITALVVM